jgi:hypothetical protein
MRQLSLFVRQHANKGTLANVEYFSSRLLSTKVCAQTPRGIIFVIGSFASDRRQSSTSASIGGEAEPFVDLGEMKMKNEISTKYFGSA